MQKKLNLPNINYIIISGRLTQDVDLRYTPSGTPTANILIANDRAYRDKDGNWQQDTNFLKVVAWTRNAEWAAENLKKGAPIIIEGRLSAKTWQDKDGNNRKTVEIVAFRIQNLERRISNNQNKQIEKTSEEENSEDDIPF